MVEALETSLPGAETILSTRITEATISRLMTMSVIQSVVMRATIGTGVAITAEVGDWNSSTASGRGSSSVLKRASALPP
jgi:hypothetical protein